METTVAITKTVDLEQLARELRAVAPGVSGISLDGKSTLIVQGTGLTPRQILAAVAAHVPISPPDAPGFERALLALFPTALSRNTLLARYPLFLWAVRGGVWTDVKALADAALAAAAITQAEYDGVVAAARANGIQWA